MKSANPFPIVVASAAIIDSHGADEDRLLRSWTPVLLRTVLAVAMLLLALSVFQTLAHSTSDGFATLGRITAQPHGAAALALAAAAHGDAIALATLGLMVLTLVPLIRVAFCLLFFLQQGNRLYVMMTAYVFAVLTAGIVLGRMG